MSGVTFAGILDCIQRATAELYLRRFRYDRIVNDVLLDMMARRQS